MGVSRWLVACSLDMRDAVRDAVGEAAGKGERIELDFFDSAADLRQQLSRERDAYVAIGPMNEGDISDVNLAAALVSDGHARRIMLVRRQLSGSFMSRARQAGVALVAEARTEGTCLYPLNMPETPIKESGVGGELISDLGEDGFVSRDPVALAEVPSVVPFALSVPAAPAHAAPETASHMLAASEPVVPELRKQRTLEEGRAPVLVVASGRGGVGKTTLAGLLGLQARAWGMRVALVDADLAQGNLRALLGAGRQGVIYVRGTEPESLDELMQDGLSADLGTLFFGPCEKPEDADVAASLVSPLLERLCSEVDLVVVDTSNTVTDAVADAMQAADRLLLLSDDMPGGLASLARVSGLAVRLGVARARIVRVINHCDPREPPDLQAGRAEVGLEMARVHQLAEGGIEVTELAAEGALGEVFSECRELGASVATCLARILGELRRLPDVPEAHEALEGVPKRKFLPFLRKQREAS